MIKQSFLMVSLLCVSSAYSMWSWRSDISQETAEKMVESDARTLERSWNDNDNDSRVEVGSDPAPCRDFLFNSDLANYYSPADNSNDTSSNTDSIIESIEPISDSSNQDN